MKKIVLSTALLSLILTIDGLQAQAVPSLINYQGRVTDSTGTGLGTGAPVNRKMIFRIFDAPTGGNRLWSEEEVVTVANGEFSVLLGSGNIATYSNVQENPRPSLLTVFNGTDRYLELVVDDGDGILNNTDTPIAPRQRLTSTAYAMRAATADSVASGTSLTFNDANTGLGFYGTSPNRSWNGQNIDGPVLYGNNGGALGSNTAGTANTALRWTSAGNVGIGNFAPTEKLDITGNLKVSGSGTFGGNLTTSGDISFPSDKTLTLRDSNHGLAWFGADKPFGGAEPDGPVLFGNSGGALGTTGGGQRVALQWDNNTNLTANGHLLAKAGLSLGTEGFGANPDEGGATGNFISFSHPGSSEDFIGYFDNTFYMKDSPGGADISQPDLVVGGNITSASKSVVVGEENLRMVRGTVAADGTILHGAGFTVSGNDGTRVINLNSAFSGTPTVTATPYRTGRGEICQIASVGNSSFTIWMSFQTNASNTNSNDGFGISFIAIGPR